MDLYIVETHCDYEGFIIMGIFDTEEAVRARACERDCEGYDAVVVAKMVLNTRYDICDNGEEVWKQA